MSNGKCREWYIKEHQARQGNGNRGRTKTYFLGPRCWKGTQPPCPHDCDDYPFCKTRGVKEEDKP